jgi:predicted N-acetyltransferase YhbS
MPTLRLDYLADHPDLVPILAEWHHRQWSYLAHSATLGQRTARLRQHGRGALPTSFVALLDGAPVGSAALVANDMTDQESLSPWLANVYVVPEARRHGIGATLVRRAAQEALALGYHDLYLYTEDQTHFYAELGWQVIDRRRYRGYLMSVMALHLDGDTPPAHALAISNPQRQPHEKE